MFSSFVIGKFRLPVAASLCHSLQPDPALVNDRRPGGGAEKP